MNNGNLRNFIVWVILAFSLLGLYNLIDNPIVSKNQSEITFSQLLAEVDAGNVVDVEISGDNISGHYSDGRSFKTFAPSDPTLIDRLYNRGVSISAKPEKEGGSIFLNILMVPNAIIDCCMDLFYASNARWRRKSYGLW